ncbi:hypothetical protein D0T49_03035 [Paludibacter sp. 221]|uniref:sugar transferase n=1 Tax=Paludibacter sp. 221 TaxID=2302939 RepID=UPI0013D793B7|nr:sugar transferase [Paludibacter sp. 221]NDV46014.1 hypothetical protein [Paludibacter sp. 221]
MKFYKPSIISLIINIFSLSITFGIVLGWFPIMDRTPSPKLPVFLLTFASLWLILAYVFLRWKRNVGYFKAALRLFFESLTIFAILYLFYKFSAFADFFSLRLLTTSVISVFAIEYVIISIYYAYRYATTYDIPEDIETEETRENAELIPAPPISEEKYKSLLDVISSKLGKGVAEYLSKYIDLKSGNLRFLFGNDLNDLKLIENYHYSSFIEMERLNDLRKINIMLYQLNKKLPDNGLFICYFESKSTRKKYILRKYRKPLNYIVYTFDYIIKRIIPRIFITRRLYYDITKGRNRIFSKAEVLGRLYCFGYEVVDTKKINNLNFVVARRITTPRPLEKRTYGPLIRLPRIGKKGKRFNVYKMRTMHPYSEFLQSYIFEKNNLQEGGKIKRDIRVTTLGHCMRKYWIDEFPMFINLIKGDMKLIGVRPLSQHYFSLYSKELQEKRIKFRPGLLPPFYADMPKTLDEIQASEMRYLNACEKDGVFLTDFRYFFKITHTIIFKKARSA